MIQDKENIFSGALASDGSRTGQVISGTTFSTNVLDLRNSSTLASGAESEDGISGKTAYVTFHVVQGFNNLTSLTVSLQTDEVSSMAGTTILGSKTFQLSELTTNRTIWSLPMPLGLVRRYLAAVYIVNGTSPTQGSIFAYVSLSRQRNVVYGGGFAVR